jgi:hypothetical protein
MSGLIERLVFSFVAETAEYQAASQKVDASLDALASKDSKTTDTFQKNSQKKADAVKDVGEKAAMATQAAGNGAAGAIGALDPMISGLRTSLTGLIAPLAGFIALSNLFGGSQRAFEYADRIGQLSESLGISQNELSAWGGAIESVADGSLEDLASSIKSVSQSIELMSQGLPVRSAKVFASLGIDAKKYAGNVFGLFERLNPILSGMDAQKALGLGERLGLTESMVRLLRNTPEDFKKNIEYQKKYTAITKKSEKASAEFGLTFDMFAPLSRAVFNQINSLVLPVLNMFLTGLSSLIKFMIDHKPFAIAFFTGLAFVIGGLLVPTLHTMAVAAWGAIKPILAMALPFAGLALMIAFLYDEWVTFTQGGKTLIGSLFKDFINGSVKVKIFSGVIIAAIFGITAAFGVLVAKKMAGFALMIGRWALMAASAVANAATTVASIGLMVASWVAAGVAWVASAAVIAAGWLVAFWPVALVIAAIAAVGVALYALYKNWDKIKAWIGEGWDALKAKIGAVYDWFVEKFNAIKEFFGMTTKIEVSSNVGGDVSARQNASALFGTSGITNQNSLSTTNNQTAQNVSVNLGQLNIQTAATDAGAIASSIQSPLSNIFGQSALQFGGGVAR